MSQLASFLYEQSTWKTTVMCSYGYDTDPLVYTQTHLSTSKKTPAMIRMAYNERLLLL